MRKYTIVKNIILLIMVFVVLGMTGCSSKAPGEHTLKDITEDLPKWFMEPKDAMGPNYICEVGSDRTRTGAILEGKENLMQLIETEVKVHAQTKRNGSDSAWRSTTDFRSEGLLRKATIQKYKFGPDEKLYVLLCIDKNDLPWNDW